jgi:hypothetical protein
MNTMTNQILTEAEVDLLQAAAMDEWMIDVVDEGFDVFITVEFSNTRELSEKETISSAESIWQEFIDRIIPNNCPTFHLNDYLLFYDDVLYRVSFQIRVLKKEA